MKKLLCIALLFLSSNVWAQNWCAPGATWTYHAGLHDQGFQRLTYWGDTLIDGQVAHKIDRYTAIQYPQPPPAPLYGGPPVISYTPLAALTRVEDDVVFLRQGTEWDTLYWFGAMPGDRWTPAFMDLSNCDPLVVSYVGTEVIHGVPLRWVEGENWPRVYERIGSVFDLYMYCPNWIIDGPTGLRCYSDVDISFSNVQGPCEVLASVEGIDGSGALQVFPNPGADHFTFSGNPSRTTMQVFDAMGRKATGLYVMEGTPVNATDWASGLYFFRFPELGLYLRWMKE